ncbi:MAG: hypothetical protein E6G33_04530 [Actinobacteria bacterium]|nr:MAG: hypothetical protein E6G33_04530 [Actinomycetota bacterium]
MSSGEAREAEHWRDWRDRTRPSRSQPKRWRWRSRRTGSICARARSSIRRTSSARAVETTTRLEVPPPQSSCTSAKAISSWPSAPAFSPPPSRHSPPITRTRDRRRAWPGDARTTMPRAALCLIVLAAALASGGATPAATSNINGHLLVATGHRHNMALFAMQPQNGDRLLLNYGTDQGAAYSPDGTKIAFMNNYDGDFEICVMNADGTGIKQLTKNSAIDGYPTWSPDGRKIAFASDRDGDDDIWVMNADGSDQTNITSDDPSNNEDPHWSPDGRWIGSTTDGYGVWHVLLLSPDGKFQATLTGRRMERAFWCTAAARATSTSTAMTFPTRIPSNGACSRERS